MFRRVLYARINQGRFDSWPQWFNLSLIDLLHTLWLNPGCRILLRPYPNFIFLAFEHDIYCNIPVSLNVYCVSYLLLVYTYFLTHLTYHAYQVPHNTRVKCSYDWEKLMCNFWCNESFLSCEVGETLWYKNFTH